MLRAVKNGAESEIMIEPTTLRIIDVKEYFQSPRSGRLHIELGIVAKCDKRIFQ